MRVERVGSALACTGSYGTLQVPPSLLGRVSDAKVLEDLRGQVPPESCSGPSMTSLCLMYKEDALVTVLEVEFAWQTG
mgnify:CR=1 FL=1